MQPVSRALHAIKMKDTTELKKTACQLAKRLLSSDEDYLDITLDLWRTGEKLLGTVWDSEFHIFGVISSDTDHLPLKYVRQHCSAKMLEKSDKELNEIIRDNKNEVTEACKSILENYEHM